MIESAISMFEIIVPLAFIGFLLAALVLLLQILSAAGHGIMALYSFWVRRTARSSASYSDSDPMPWGL